MKKEFDKPESEQSRKWLTPEEKTSLWDFIRQEEEKIKQKEMLNRLPERNRIQEEIEAARLQNYKRQQESIREEEEKKLAFKDNLIRLIQEIEQCADEKPCPTCNELEVLILSISPNARSLLVRCKNCQREYHIKMESDDPEKIINRFNSFMEGRNSYLTDTKDALPIWRMVIKKRQITNLREPIPTSVKKAVWKRDEGKCVICGSELELEYDHIIPVAKGGASTIQNIQILCKKCNRKKHASIE